MNNQRTVVEVLMMRGAKMAPPVRRKIKPRRTQWMKKVVVLIIKRHYVAYNYPRVI